MIFDGKKFGKELEDQVKIKVINLEKKLHVVSLVVGEDPASALYTKLKKSAAERVGIEFEVISEKGELKSEELKQIIAEIGKRDDVTGVMVQLPIPGLQGQTLQEVLSAIPLTKDMDGLRWEESGTMPATVKAVIAILDDIANRKSSDHSLKITQGSELWEQKFVVIGARGAVGRPLVHFLKARGVVVSEVEWDTPEPTKRILEGEVVISCVGKAGIVTDDMVRDGVIAIDVGMSEKIVTNPKFSNSQIKTVVGDMTKEVYQKASISVQVPGGVGPVTIACLLQNSLELSERL